MTGNSVGTYRDGIQSVCRKTKGEEFIESSNKKNIYLTDEVKDKLSPKKHLGALCETDNDCDTSKNSL